MTAAGGGGAGRSAVASMLEARSVALVGASPRPGSFGDRALVELSRSSSGPDLHLVNPRYAGTEIAGRPVVASLEELDGPVDLALLAVGDQHLEAELSRAATTGARSAVIYASAVDPRSPSDSSVFRARLGRIAREAGMALCGGGCMGFVNASVGLRAIGYLERYPLPVGPITLVTHSGSAFSALLRTDRPYGFDLAVSSGQELVTTAAEYLGYALDAGRTELVVLVLETMRSPEALRAGLARAADRDLPVVALTVGASEAGRAMVAAHSGALAGSDGAWEALFDAYGVVRVHDLSELCDTVELLLCPRRPPRRPDGGGGLAAVLDSGAERALLVDVASQVGARFAELSPETLSRLGDLLDPGLEATNPLDVWGSGRSTVELFSGSLTTLADDPGVDAVALAVDLVPEFDGDESYRDALVEAWQRTPLPLCLLSHLPSALDRDAAARLRSLGIPVLEGTRTGLAALSHLLERRDRADRPAPELAVLDPARRERWRTRLAAGPLSSAEQLVLLEQYGLQTVPTRIVTDRDGALAAAGELGLPVALKTAEESVAHKTEVGGVHLGLATTKAVAAAYDDLAGRLGRTVAVAAMAPPGVELALGLVADPLLGPLVVVGAGGILVELLADRAVALPPVDRAAAGRMIDRLRIRHLLDGVRGAPPADLDAACEAVAALSVLAADLGDLLAALDLNPLRCTPAGAFCLDVLVETVAGPPA